MKTLVVLISFYSLNAAAAEVVKFDPRPAVVEQEGDTYLGILLSEEYFRQMLQKKINTNAQIAECKVDQRVCKHIQDSYKEYISRLENRLQKNNSWLDRNRGSLGLLTGLIVGTGLSIGIVHAVYQAP